MRITVLLIALLLSTLGLPAQPAPDFTVTDSHGQVHHLYADYLNQGKTVVLEVFFTTCPPCNSIAPLLQPLYVEWGEGNNDVEFIELSDKSFDTDALVNAYQAQYGETMVGVGKDGGSLAAVVPYENGTYGQWFGTPCFVVIAPNGTVNYDVSGSGNQGTINAVDAAITATGAVKPGMTPVAPDFTLQDYEGQVHHLYPDYLNIGKTVVLEIFNTNCSNCNSIAPLLEPLYTDWGGGDADVEFFALTDSPTDNNQVMFDYMINYNLTFPGISSGGGSLSAVIPYENGTFGPFTGLPTFVVIAPNGTVNYNVHGANNQATITALNAAISATGAQSGQMLTTAPDFTVTDSHGQTHHLYADYLNQGKSVLLEVFYTTCPPCNSIAPLMEPFYQEWGEGDYDVEFLEMSNKNFDTDALVNAYQAQYGETFIGVGKDGGSLNAVQPYMNGSFGNWYGTPTYVVIAPDGTVQYDVRGPNNQATIDLLDAALLATGAQKPPPPESPVEVTGLVTYLMGSTGVGNAYVQIVDSLDNVIKQDTTNVSGNFDLAVYLSQLQPDWRLKVVKNGSPTNGVNALDLVRIQKHILLLEPFADPLTKLAVDINKSGSISALDIVILTKLLLGINTQFADGQNWITVPADTDFGPPAQHPPILPASAYSIPVQDIINGTRTAHFLSVKRGDANGNANPN
jgi:thiol-disulfide isomerase/thioredoxin